LRRIPVVDNDNRVVGIIAQADWRRALTSRQKLLKCVKTFRSPTRVKSVLEILGGVRCFSVLAAKSRSVDVGITERPSKK